MATDEYGAHVTWDLLEGVDFAGDPEAFRNRCYAMGGKNGLHAMVEKSSLALPAPARMTRLARECRRDDVILDGGDEHPLATVARVKHDKAKDEFCLYVAASPAADGSARTTAFDIGPEDSVTILRPSRVLLKVCFYGHDEARNGALESFIAA